MCDAWAEEDSRVRVIHKENGGVASARNVRRDNAVGQYIGFVDSDDWIDSTMIAELVSCAAEYHTDVTGMLYRVVYSNGWKTDMRIADDVPDIIYSKNCMESFYGCNKELCKRKQKALTGITLDGQEKCLWLFYFRFPHLYCKLLHFYHFLRKNLH